jgi:hypothetical protein
VGSRITLGSGKELLMEFDQDFGPLEDDPVESGEGGDSVQEKMDNLNVPFEASMTILEGIQKVFEDVGEDEGRDEIGKALEHVKEAWMAKNRKLYELAAEPT